MGYMAKGNDELSFLVVSDEIRIRHWLQRIQQQRIHCSREGTGWGRRRNYWVPVSFRDWAHLILGLISLKYLCSYLILHAVLLFCFIDIFTRERINFLVTCLGACVQVSLLRGIVLLWFMIFAHVYNGSIATYFLETFKVCTANPYINWEG